MPIFPQKTTLFRHPRYHACSGHLPPGVATAVITTKLRRSPPDQVALHDPPPLLVLTTQQQQQKQLLPNNNDRTTVQSTWSHRAWVAMGCTSVLLSLLKSTLSSIHSHTFLEPALAGFLGYVLADLASGVYHWAIDNYGDASTPLFGAQIEAFQGHHKRPWTITRRQFANNLHGLARAVAFTVIPIDIACGDDPAVNAFVGVCSGCILFSQQFHAWAHGTRSRLPQAVVALQDACVLVSPAVHGKHHRPPYNNNYCIVSGAWNGVLDEMRVFEAVEMVLFFKYGVRPRSWSEPDSDWNEEFEMPLVGHNGS